MIAPKYRRVDSAERTSSSSLVLQLPTLLILMCLLVTPAFAVEEDSVPEPEPEQRQVVVTATRVAKPADQIGSAVTVVTAEEIERHQDRFAVDALRRVPGVTVRSDGGRPGARTSIFIRGADGDQTLVLINGVKVHDPSSPNRSAFLEHLPAEDIERIEVLRGPQSTLYGSEAIGGVINIITKQGSDEPSFGASFEGGSYSTFTESASARGSVGPVKLSLSGTRVDSRGISAATRDDDERDAYTDSSAAFRMSVTPNEIVGGELYLQYLASEIQIDAGGNFRKSDTESEQILFSAEPRLTLFDGLWEQKLRYWLNDTDRENDGTGFALPSDFQSRLQGVDWQNQISPIPEYTAVVGIEYQEEEGTFNQGPFATEFDANTHNVAYYLDNQVALWDRLFITAGVRLDDDDRFGTRATYRVTNALKIKETSTTLRGSVGTGFKAPSLAQSFDRTFGSNNPNLDPEESFGLDIGFEQSFCDQRFTLSGAYFYNNIDDLVVTVFDPVTFTSLNVNVEAVKTQGVEVGLFAQLHRMLSMQASYTYTDTKAERAASFGLMDGSRLLRRPAHEFNVDLSGSFLDDRLKLTFNILYVGKRSDLDPTTFATVQAGSYVLANLSGSFRIDKRVELFARVENLFDENYEDVLGFRTPGVSAFGGIRLRFP